MSSRCSGQDAPHLPLLTVHPPDPQPSPLAPSRCIKPCALAFSGGSCRPTAPTAAVPPAAAVPPTAAPCCGAGCCCVACWCRRRHHEASSMCALPTSPATPATPATRATPATPVAPVAPPAASGEPWDAAAATPVVAAGVAEPGAAAGVAGVAAVASCCIRWLSAPALSAACLSLSRAMDIASLAPAPGQGLRACMALVCQT